MNNIVDPKVFMKDMNQFSTEMDKMELTTEAWDDMVDIFDGDGVEEESDNVMNQILDDLGISIGQQLPDIQNTTKLPVGKSQINNSVFSLPTQDNSNRKANAVV